MFEPTESLSGEYAATRFALFPDELEIDESLRTARSDTLSLFELEAQITELAGHLNAANHRWLMLIAEFDRREGWGDGSTQSCASTAVLGKRPS